MNREEILQLKFEQSIELLVLYKQQNPNKNVYLSEKSLSESIKWYQNYIDTMSKNIKE